MKGGGAGFANQAVCRCPRIEAVPGVFLENETLFHKGENSWPGREKSSHFSILKEKYSVASDTIAFILEF